MLVLSRQRDETIVMSVSPEQLRELVAAGKPLQIEVTIVDIRGDKVRIGTAAPAEVSVDRKEVAENKLREGIRAPHPRPPL